MHETYDTSDFLSTLIKDFDLIGKNSRNYQKRNRTKELIFTFQEEVKPKDIRLPPTVKPISLTPAPNYFYHQQLGVYLPEQHRDFSYLIEEELTAKYKTPHGSYRTYKKGCRGPLCRRANRLSCQELTQLRTQRLEYLNQVRVIKPVSPRVRKDEVVIEVIEVIESKPDKPEQPKPITPPPIRPVNKSLIPLEPLLILSTARAYRMSPSNGYTFQEREFSRLLQLEQELAYVRQEYPDLVGE